MFADKETSKERYEICKACQHFSKLKICTACGCFLPAKVTMAKSSCPKGKWMPIQPDKTVKERHNVE